MFTQPLRATSSDALLAYDAHGRVYKATKDAIECADPNDSSRKSKVCGALYGLMIKACTLQTLCCVQNDPRNGRAAQLKVLNLTNSVLQQLETFCVSRDGTHAVLAGPSQRVGFKAPDRCIPCCGSHTRAVGAGQALLSNAACAYFCHSGSST